MYRWSVVLFLLCMAPLIGNAQQVELLPSLLNSYPTAHPQEITARINAFTSNLQQKKGKRSDKDFLTLVFRESHRKFLRSYQPYAQFSEIFETGTYDCLSATSLLSVVLEKFDFDFRIIETNYHIFIVVETTDGPMLLESTDKFNGIVSDPNQIEKRVSRYQSNELVINPLEANKDHYKFDLNLYQLVQPTQLPGLLYFNQAVIAYNERNLIECATKLDKARRIYESPRTAEFAVILVKSVAASELNDEIKKDLIRPFVMYLKNTNSAIASR